LRFRVSDYDISRFTGEFDLVGMTEAEKSAYVKSSDLPTVVPANETDPLFSASPAADITEEDITNLGNLSGENTGDQTLPTRESLGLDTDDTVTFANLSGDNTGDQVGDGVTITGAGTVADPFVAAGGSGASTALDNLASVAINTSLVSDTDDTDDLGSSAKKWKDLYIDGVAYLDDAQVSSLTASKAVFTDASKNLTSTGIGTAAQQIQGDGSLITTAMTFVDTASPSAAANFTISGLSPNINYKLFLNLNNSGASNFTVTFNGDTGTNYKTNYSVVQGGATAVGNLTGLAGFSIGGGAGDAHHEISFSTAQSSAKIVNLVTRGILVNGTYMIAQAGYYSGASNLSSMTISLATGTMTGTASLYRLN